MANNTNSRIDTTEQQLPTKGPKGENTTSVTGRRPAFQDLKRELSDKDLASPGTQKLLLEMLVSAETERDEYKTYVTKFYETDKQNGVLSEKIKTNKINEIMFGVGVGLGGAIIGLAPLLWSTDPSDHKGPITLATGVVLTLGATLGRVIYK